MCFCHLAGCYWANYFIRKALCLQLLLFISGSMFPSIFLTPWGKYDQRFDLNKENLITGDAEHGHPEESPTAAHLREAPIWNLLFPFGHCPLRLFRISKWDSGPPPPLHGKIHLEFPFWLFDCLPKRDRKRNSSLSLLSSHPADFLSVSPYPRIPVPMFHHFLLPCWLPFKKCCLMISISADEEGLLCCVAMF